jgi:hypothetical protein
VSRPHRLLPVALLIVALLPSSSVVAQDEERPLDRERAGRSRGGYAWGEPAPEQTGAGDRAAPAAPAVHRFHHIFTSLGVGGTVRVVAHADVCNPDVPGLQGCRFSPPYLQLRGVFFVEGDGDLQHGLSLGIATNLTADGLRSQGIDPLAQWVFSPAYALRVWISEWFQLMGQAGSSFALAGLSGDSVRNSTAFNWALELQLTAILKFLAGLGVYVAVNGATWFAGTGSVWPTLSFEGGAVVEYEVLP